MVVGEFTEDVDVAIIGGGPAGYHAAFDLARGGRAPIVIDPRGRLGGTCLFAGCIGSKTLIEHVCHQGASVESAIAESTKAIETLKQIWQPSASRQTKNITILSIFAQLLYDFFQYFH